MPPSSPLLAAADLHTKTLTLRAALALPEQVQRSLAGARITVDGQTLATDTQLMLRLQRLVREPDVATLPIPEGRRALVLQATIAGGQQPIGSIRDVPVGDLRGRLYTPTGAGAEPPGSDARSPLLVFFHGGGWVYGDLDSHDPACRFLAQRSGVRVLAIDYRLAPEHPYPAAYDDAVAAYRWVVEHASSLGADREQLGIGGDSAGGTLAAATAMVAAREGLPLAFQLLVYPGTDMTRKTTSRQLFGEGYYLTNAFMDLAMASYLPDRTRRADPEASPLLADVPAGLAPAYVVTAGFDPLRDEGEAYARKLADAGVPLELRRFPDQIHGFLNVVGAGRSARASVAEIASRLAAGLAG